jgi:hypothetical protein
MAIKMNPNPGDGYADSTSRIRAAAADLGTYLALWDMRKQDEADAASRGAANEAITAIDEATAALHAVRSRLVGEMRDYDDETARRTDELLARRRAEREDGAQ